MDLCPGKLETGDPLQHLPRRRGSGISEIRHGKFTEVMLIRTSGDLKELHRLYGIGESELSPQY